MSSYHGADHGGQMQYTEYESDPKTNRNTRDKFLPHCDPHLAGEKLKRFQLLLKG